MDLKSCAFLLALCYSIGGNEAISLPNPDQERDCSVRYDVCLRMRVAETHICDSARATCLSALPRPFDNADNRPAYTGGDPQVLLNRVPHLDTNKRPIFIKGGLVDCYNCTSQPNGNYPAPCDCTKFIMCSNGYAYEFDCAACDTSEGPERCPDGKLHFSVELDRCEWASVAQCTLDDSCDREPPPEEPPPEEPPPEEPPPEEPPSIRLL